LADLSATLNEVCVARREIMAELQAGEAERIFDDKSNWAIPSEPLRPDIGLDQFAHAQEIFAQRRRRYQSEEMLAQLYTG
jgi:hypothetical protein